MVPELPTLILPVPVVRPMVTVPAEAERFPSSVASRLKVPVASCTAIVVAFRSGSRVIPLFAVIAVPRAIVCDVNNIVEVPAFMVPAPLVVKLLEPVSI